jgi:hypothetical protein
MQQPGQQQQHVQQAPVAAAAAVADEGSEVSSLQQLCKQQLLEWRSVVELRCSDAGVVAWLLLTSSRVDKRSREEVCGRVVVKVLLRGLEQIVVKWNRSCTRG